MKKEMLKNENKRNNSNLTYPEPCRTDYPQTEIARYPQTEMEKASYPSNKTSRGFESGIDQSDIIKPRAKLLQALSPELNEGFKQGQIINSATKEVLGEEFIPIFFFKEFIRFNPKNSEDKNFNADYLPGSIIWRSTDPSDPRVLKETVFNGDEKPLAISFLNFFSYFPDQPMPIIVGFSKTSYKEGKKLLSLARFVNEDMFSRKYKLSSVKEKNEIASYYVFSISPIGKASNTEVDVCENLWKEFSQKQNIAEPELEEVYF